MLATARHASALALAAALVLNTASPVLAADFIEDTADGHVAVTVTPAMVSALTTALTPSVLAEVVQRPPLPVPMHGPRVETDVFESPAFRRSLYVSFGALNVLDALSTRKALNAGAREANPAMAGVANNSAALLAVKAGGAVATTFFAEKLAKKHPRRAAIVMAVLNGAYAAIAVHNFRVAQRQR